MTSDILAPTLIPQDPPPPPPEYRVGQAKVQVIQSQSLVNHNPKGFISSYNAVINPYSGCTFGCSYCYASGTAFTQSQARTNDWGNWVDVKANAALKVAQTKPNLSGRTCYMSTATDPYQPVELQAKITRGILEALADRHPRVKLVIQTRSPFVTRDLDLLEEIVLAGGRVQVNMTITTAHEPTRKAYERGCASTAKRLEAIKTIAQAGIQACITMTPALDVGLSPERDRQTLDMLLEAHKEGVERFIFQPFHAQTQNGAELGAATRAEALAITRDLLQLDQQMPHERLKVAYRGAYIDGLRRIKPELEKAGAWVGTNRDGFKPPF